MKRQWIYRLSILAVLINLMMPLTASAAALTSRKVTLGSSAISTSTSHNFTFTAPTATTIKSIDFTYCTTASGTCTTPVGLTTTTATLNGAPTNLGGAGTWTIGGTPTNGRIQIANASNTGSPTANATVNFNAITNPSTTNQTFFIRIVTYSDAAWTTSLDSGNVAASTANAINVTASVDETLTFCVYTGGSCGAGGSAVALGTLTTSTTGTGTSKMDVATNGSGGYNVTYTGTTLTGPSAITIPAMGTQSTNGTGTASTQNSSQFGINFRANTTPTIGTDVSGTGTGTYGTNYGVINSFRHFSGDTVATAAAATNSNTFTASYIANISGAQAAGAYTTTLTYICTATY